MVEKPFWYVSKSFVLFSWQETAEDKNNKLFFIKCHCPFEVLKYYAEDLSFKAPLEVRNNFTSSVFLANEETGDQEGNCLILSIPNQNQNCQISLTLSKCIFGCYIFFRDET